MNISEIFINFILQDGNSRCLFIIYKVEVNCNFLVKRFLGNDRISFRIDINFCCKVDSCYKKYYICEIYGKVY